MDNLTRLCLVTLPSIAAAVLALRSCVEIGDVTFFHVATANCAPDLQKCNPHLLY